MGTKVRTTGVIVCGVCDNLLTGCSPEVFIVFKTFDVQSLVGPATDEVNLERTQTPLCRAN